MGKKSNQNNKENQPAEVTSKYDNKKISSQVRSPVSFDNTLMFRKKQWTQKQDKILIKTIKQHGPKKWSFIAEFIPGRIGKQCRERWHNHLNPKINKQQWSQLQQWVLFLMHTAFGGKWARMTKTLTKRTDNSIKNHWNSIMQKKIQYFKQKLQESFEKPQIPSVEYQYQKEDEFLSREIKHLMQIIKNGQRAPSSSLSQPISRNASQLNEESLTSNFYINSKSIDEDYKSQNSLNLRTTNLLQSFRNPSEQISIPIQNIQQQEVNEVLLEKNMSFFNSKIESSDIGLQGLLQKYDHVPNLTKKTSYNYFPSCRLNNIELARQNSCKLYSNRKNSSMIDQNYESPTKKRPNYSNVFDEQNEENMPLPEPKQLDSPLVPLLRRNSSRNRSFMSPTRFLQNKTSSSSNN